MKLKINVRSCINGFFEYLLAFVVILECRSIWNNVTTTRNNLWLVFLVLLTVAVFGSILTHKGLMKSNFVKALQTAAVLVLYCAVYVIGCGYKLSIFFRFAYAVILLTLFFYCCNYRQKMPSILQKYQNLVLIIACISLFFWLFGSVLNVIRPSGSVIMNWSGNGEDAAYASYYNLHFEVQAIKLDFLGMTSYRNTSLFVEAPMFAFHLALALMIEFFMKSKEEFSKYKVAILIITILTTFSTTGYVVIAFALVTKILSSKRRSGMRRVIYILAPFVLLIGGTIVAQLIFKKLGTGSGTVRVDDIAVCIKAWTTNLFFGAGFDNYEYVQSLMGEWRSHSTGLSSAMMIVLAYGGLYLAIPYVGTLIFGAISGLTQKRMELTWLSVGLFFTFFVTAVPFQYIFLYMLIYLANANQSREAAYEQSKEIN